MQRYQGVVMAVCDMMAEQEHKAQADAMDSTQDEAHRVKSSQTQNHGRRPCYTDTRPGKILVQRLALPLTAGWSYRLMGPDHDNKAG
jgi:hypothetical protein